MKLKETFAYFLKKGDMLAFSRNGSFEQPTIYKIESIDKESGINNQQVKVTSANNTKTMFFEQEEEVLIVEKI